MDLVYSLRNASLCVEDGRFVLQRMDWSAPARSISVVFGAGGAGKTSFLRALAGVRGPPIVPRGSWSFRGQDFFGPERKRALDRRVAWCAQPPRGWPRERGHWGPGLRGALTRDEADVVLLDEPSAWVHEDEHPRLIEEILRCGRRSTLVISTHNVEFGRNCADHACLLGGGRIIAASEASAFFSSPSPLVRHLLRSGSFRMGAAGPLAPVSLRWVLDRHLGGMAKPGLTRPLEDDLAYLQAREVTVLVTLTEDPLDEETRAQLMSHGVRELLHVPIRDMGVPSLAAAARITWRISQMLAEGHVVVVHCRGGLGRTGLVLALVLVAQGQPAGAAIEFVRSMQPLYIQTGEQLAFIHEMEPALTGQRIAEDGLGNE